MKRFLPGLIAGALVGLTMWIATGTFWFLPLGMVLGVVVMPLALREESKYHSRKKREQNFRD